MATYSEWLAATFSAPVAANIEAGTPTILSGAFVKEVTDEGGNVYTLVTGGIKTPVTIQVNGTTEVVTVTNSNEVAGGAITEYTDLDSLHASSGVHNDVASLVHSSNGLVGNFRYVVLDSTDVTEGWIPYGHFNLRNADAATWGTRLVARVGSLPTWNGKAEFYFNSQIEFRLWNQFELNNSGSVYQVRSVEVDTAGIWHRRTVDSIVNPVWGAGLYSGADTTVRHGVVAVSRLDAGSDWQGHLRYDDPDGANVTISNISDENAESGPFRTHMTMLPGTTVFWGAKQVDRSWTNAVTKTGLTDSNIASWPNNRLGSVLVICEATSGTSVNPGLELTDMWISVQEFPVQA
jgi:hypothetical protein